jgi:uncharacterized protein (TIGR04255 family)
MVLPKKIDSRCVKDAIIEIRYSSKLPFEVLVGYIFKSIDDNFTYSNRPINPQEQLNFQFSIQHLFFNEKIKFQLQPNSIIFNCLNEYVLWDEYLPQIENVINQILKIEEIDSFTRVGVRYISEFEMVDFKDTLNFNFSFNQPSIASNTYSFKSEFEIDKGFVIFQLHNKLRLIQNAENSDVFFSQIDIDVVNQNLSVLRENHIELFRIIDDLHSIEKRLFFDLLKPEFLKSLNPVY